MKFAVKIYKNEAPLFPRLENKNKNVKRERERENFKNDIQLH